MREVKLRHKFNVNGLATISGTWSADLSNFNTSLTIGCPVLASVLIWTMVMLWDLLIVFTENLDEPKIWKNNFKCFLKRFMKNFVPCILLDLWISAGLRLEFQPLPCPLWIGKISTNLICLTVCDRKGNGYTRFCFH